MAPTILQVMQGIEARLNTITGLRVSDIAPDQINPPAAVVGVPAVPAYHATMGRGRFQLAPTVTVLVSAGLDRVGQHKLAGYANPTGALSVVAAVEADKTLGGVVDDCHVVGFRPLGLEEIGLIGYYGGVFELRVIATGV
ncbi:hypothetical protein GCM10010124_26170 [Pilimelia terevasa]|uniref:Uncharacterized protein n=1 Tax=Pilimelia terevasa TaxID=53372 RepID=A0A8J3BSH3_9ACTN|nr:hypothetical protein [Pilimelia terevasa]GGK32144.1 hypothetical protein GCM10010124_26170 [Pilimelia terevasa]